MDQKIEKEKADRELKDICDILVKNPGIHGRELELALKIKEAQRVNDKFSNLKTVAMQKILMNAYYETETSHKKSYKDFFRSLSKGLKLAILIGFFWTIYVIYRTVSYHELLGIDLMQWNESSFLVNWISVPALSTILFFAYAWIYKPSIFELIFKNKKSIEKKLLLKVDTWEKEEKNRFIEIIKNILNQDHKAVFELMKNISDSHFEIIVEYVKIMKKPKLKK